MRQYDKLEEALNNLLLMDILKPHYETELNDNADIIMDYEKRYVRLRVGFDREMRGKQEAASAQIKEEMEDRMREQERREEMETNREEREDAKAERENRAMEMQLQIINATAAADAAAAERAAHAIPVVPVAHPDHPVDPPVPVHHDPPRLFREVKAMHPGKISIESNPQELRVFVDNYMSWYNISNVDVLNPAQQISTLKACCSEAIQERIAWADEVNIDTAIQSLRGLFLTEYPIITRQLQYLKTHKKTMSPLRTLYCMKGNYIQQQT